MTMLMMTGDIGNDNYGENDDETNVYNKTRLTIITGDNAEDGHDNDKDNTYNNKDDDDGETMMTTMIMVRLNGDDEIQSHM